MKNRKEFLQSYIKFGWKQYLIPLNEKKRITKTEEQFDIEDEKWDKYRLGLKTGQSGYIVVEIDNFGPELAEWENKLEDTNTRKVKTPKGTHYYFQYDRNKGIIPCSIDVLNTYSKGYAIDVKADSGDSGYVVLPDGEDDRHWEDGIFKPAPDWLYNFFVVKLAQPVEVVNIDSAIELINKYPCYKAMYENDGVHQGEHHHSAVRLIALLKDNKLDENIIFSTIVNWNDRNKNYLDNKEIRNLIFKQKNKTYLYNCKDELLLKYCNSVNCPIKQLDDRYIPITTMEENVQKIALLSVKEPEIAPEYPIRLYRLNETMWGLRRGELTVIAGFASYGKSAFVNQLAIDCLLQNKSVLIFTTESSSDEVFYRLLANYYKIPGSHFRNFHFLDYERKILEKSTNELKSWRLFICDKSKPTIEDVEFGLRRMQPDVIIIDYLQRCVSGLNRYEQLNDWMMAMKSFAKSYNIPVLVASQINRASKDDKHPGLHHLLGSGSIEQESDNVLILDRKKDSEGMEITMVGYLDKGRNCGTGKFLFKFNRQYLTFEEMNEHIVEEIQSSDSDKF